VPPEQTCHFGVALNAHDLLHQIIFGLTNPQRLSPFFLLHLPQSASLLILLVITAVTADGTERGVVVGHFDQYVLEHLVKHRRVADGAHQPVILLLNRLVAVHHLIEAALLSAVPLRSGSLKDLLCGPSAPRTLRAVLLILQ